MAHMARDNDFCICCAHIEFDTLICMEDSSSHKVLDTDDRTPDVGCIFHDTSRAVDPVIHALTKNV